MRLLLRVFVPPTVLVALLGALLGCGGRTAVAIPKAVDAGLPRASAERCDGLDNDLDLKVDEDFRDKRGNYVNDAHCGECGHACDAPIAHAEGMLCALLSDQPTCTAKSCEQGFGPSQSGTCVAVSERLCLPCQQDADCGTLVGARCNQISGEGRCTRGCEYGCPEGYVCFAGDHCEPSDGGCGCEVGGADFALACTVQGDVSGCVGAAQCAAGVLSTCRAPSELCDGLDNDCDGRADEGFLDERSVYSLDLRNCGACGIDCAADNDAGAEFTCGGDPFAPSCVTLCPDAQNGVAPGDFLDADRQVKNGCECQVRTLTDESGVAAGQTEVDSNCDGADGSVLSSFYVAVGGDDRGPGSNTRPFRSITQGIERAAQSLTGASPRPHVYVASGVYTESLRMQDGVLLHGGYRSDFLSLNPSGFPVTVVAPADSDAPGGAALVAQNVGVLPTLIEGFSFRGRDATGQGEPAIGVALLRVGAGLRLRASSVRSGKAGPGASGAAGAAGTLPLSSAGNGEPQRAAIEDASHACTVGSVNQVRGGAAGRHVCGVLDVSGGDGGSPACPGGSGLQPAGAPGRGGTSAVGGLGGAGGNDVAGPISNGNACAAPVCCGLADFSVPTNFRLPVPGQQGADGAAGVSGQACSDALGRFDGTTFIAANASSGSDGRPGGGGGGGGAGGSARMTWFDVACEFADGLGGGGGGGGAAGCGGSAGAAGQSGGPTIGILLVPSNPLALPSIEEVDLATQDGASGGDGGAGGDGGQGASGGFGGRLSDAQRFTPSLAGPGQGERGGKGGDGGAGGGAGGGCGGASVGVWIVGTSSDPLALALYASNNRFVLGDGGKAGRGGGGAMPAASGVAGSVTKVLVQ